MKKTFFLSNIAFIGLIAVFMQGCGGGSDLLDVRVKAVTKVDNKLVKSKDEKPKVYLKLDNLTKQSGDITIKNKGDKVLNIRSVSIQGNESGVLEFNNDCEGKKLRSGKMCKIDVTFNSERKIFETAKVIIETDITDEAKPVGSLMNFTNKTRGLFVVSTNVGENTIKYSHKYQNKNKFSKEDLVTNYNLVIGVQAKAMDLRQGFIEATQQEEKPVSVASLNFSRLNSAQYIKFTNNGIKNISMDDVSINGDNAKYFAHLNKCPKSLEPGKSCRIDLTFKPKDSSGMKLAYLNIDTDGTIAPSDRVRLIGNSDPYDFKIVSLKVGKSVDSFLSDYFGVNNKVFFRTMFQTSAPAKVQEYLLESLTEYAQDRGLKVVSSATSADKVVNVYPFFKFETKGKSLMNVSVGIKGSVNSKSMNTDVKYKNVEDINTTLLSKTTSINNDIMKSDDYDFFMNLSISNYADEYVVYKKITDEVTEKLFNITSIAK